MAEAIEGETLPRANHDVADWPIGDLVASESSRWSRVVAWLRKFSGITLLGVFALLGIPGALLAWGARLLVVVLAIVVGWTVKDVVSGDMIVFETFSVPRDMEGRGITGSYIVQRLLDEAHRIENNATTSRERAVLRGENRPNPLASVQLPTSEVSVDTFVALLREIFKKDDLRIGGEVVLESDGPYFPSSRVAVMVHASRGAVRHQKRFVGNDLAQLIGDASIEIMRHVDPVALASYFRSLKYYDEADAVLAHIMTFRSRPENRTPDVHSERLWARNLRGVLTAERDDNSAAAREYFEDLVNEAPTFGPALHNLAKLSFDDGKLLRAVELLETAATNNPRYSDAYLSWGAVYQSCGRHREAIVKLKKAQELNPHSARYHAVLAFSFVEIGDYRLAAHHYRLAREVRPGDTTLRYCDNVRYLDPAADPTAPRCDNLEDIRVELLGRQIGFAGECLSLAPILLKP